MPSETLQAAIGQFQDIVVRPLKFDLVDVTRLGALCDGVFAIIITLLVLEIHRPDTATGKLGEQLLQAWPSYLARA